MVRKKTVEICKGRVRWFYHVRASNGQIMTTSQKYFSKSNAQRAAQATAWSLDANLKEME